MSKWLVGVLLLAAVLPGWAGQPVVHYRNDRQVIQAGVYVLPGLTVPEEYGRFFATLDAYPLQALYTAADPDFAFEFYPPHQASWELRSPLAWDKSDLNYWVVPQNDGLEIEHLLANYDVLLAPVTGVSTLSAHQRRVLLRWVQEGGLLWLEYEPGGQVNGLLEPAPVVATEAGTTTGHEAVDPVSPLLRYPYPLGYDGLRLLGRQVAYSSVPEGESPIVYFSQGVDDDTEGYPTPLRAVVRLANGAPVVAAGRYGRGAILASACGIAAAVGAWQQGYASGGLAEALELPEWSLPDAKFALNVMAWWLGPRGNTGEAASGREHAPVPPPVAASMVVPDPALVPSATGGARRAVVYEGLAYFGDHDGNLYAIDTSPVADRDGDGHQDDGPSDWSTGGTADVVWECQLPEGFVVAGAPAVGTVYDDAAHIAMPRTMVAFCAKSPDGGQSYLDAFWADFAVRHVRPDNANPALAGANRAGGVVTMITLEPHRLRQGDVVVVDGVEGGGGLSFNGRFEVTSVIDAHTFTYAQTAGPAATGGGGVVAPALQPVPGYPFEIRMPTMPARVAGQAEAGPFFANGMLFVITRDTGNNPNIPARDAHLLAFDPTAPGNWAVHLELAQSGAVMSASSPPSMGLVPVQDAVTQTVVDAEVLVWSGNALPRTSTSATGRLWMTPAMVRVVLPGWDGRWLVDPVGQDVTANQAVQVWQGGVQIAPHRGDLPADELNYLRHTEGSQVEIIFPRWSFFRGHPTGGQDVFEIRYLDNTGVQRRVNATLSMGVAAPLNMAVSEEPNGGPCVAGDLAYVGGNAVNGYPGASFYGGVAALEKRVSGNPRIVWQFYGIKRDDANTVNQFHSFPYTPAVGKELVFVAGNLEFTQPANGAGPTTYLPDGARGVLYGLDPNCSDELRRDDGSPSVGPIDLQAPVGRSADRSGTTTVDKRGAPVYLEVVGGEPIPARMGSVNNWWVDYHTGVVHANLQLAGRYYYSLDTLVDFSYFVNGERTTTRLHLPRLVVWQYRFGTAERVVGPPVTSGNHVYVVTQANDTGEARLYAFEQQPRVGSIVERESELTGRRPVWVVSLGLHNQFTSPVTMAVANEHLVVCLDDAEGPGRVLVLGQEGTFIADNNRLVDVDGDARAAWSGLATSQASPRAAAPLLGLPEPDSYPRRVNLGFVRPSRVRVLPDGELLVCDTGNNRVVQIDRTGEIVWQYPDSTPDEPTPQELRLLSPTDVQRYVTTTSEDVNGGAVVRWESTLIADMGNCRVLEVVRPLVDGRYQPELGPDYQQQVQVIAGPETLAGGAPLGKWMFGTACRYGTQSDRIWSTRILCSVANNPANRGGAERPLGLVIVERTWNAGEGRWISTVVNGVDGYNQAEPRQVADPGHPTTVYTLNDFIDIRQADVLATGDDPPIMVVDRQGVKVIRLGTWGEHGVGGPLAHPGGAGVLEMTAADYQADMEALQADLGTYLPPSYPPCIRDDDMATAFANAQRYANDAVAAGAAGQVWFQPAYAQLLPDGKLLVVNTFGAPYDVSTAPADPLEMAGPTRSEVFEYDPAQEQGHRIFEIGSRLHFVVPDPFRASYPRVTGTAAGLKQPLAVERR